MARKSTKISWLLRHGANETGLAMDEAGWSSIADVLAILEVDREELDQMVMENNKARFTIKGDKIRAAQGHSFAGTPVTQEALEASWEPVTDLYRAFHGTKTSFLASIRRIGLIPGERTHVHMAASSDSRVGKRSGVQALLEIDLFAMRKGGVGVWRSENGVILARSVPAEHIVGGLE